MPAHTCNCGGSSIFREKITWSASRVSIRELPLNQREAFGVVFEDGLDWGVEGHLKLRVAEQIADHANVACVGEFHHHHKIGAGGLQCGMRRMPHALPAVDAPAAGYAMPSDIERVALVTNPFGAELERPACIAF